MPLKGIPQSIIPELLYALAKMGHGDYIVIADANFPSDSIASLTQIRQPIRVHGATSSILKDVLTLIDIDKYSEFPIAVMDRVQCDKDTGLVVLAYEELARAANISETDIEYIERQLFYEKAKKAFAIIQTDDRALYANVIVYKGVL